MEKFLNLLKKPLHFLLFLVKEFLYLVLFVIIVLIVIMFFTFTSTSKPVENVNNFFSAIKNNNYQEARQYLSEETKKANNVIKLQQLFPYSKFKNYEDCSFFNREIKSESGSEIATKKVVNLNGKIEFTNGSIMPIKVNLIKENDKWKINYIKSSNIELSNDAKNNLNSSLLENNLIKKSVIKESIIKLADAMESGDYNSFYNYLAPQFRENISLDKLKNSLNKMKTLFAKIGNINWDEVKQSEPVIEEETKGKYGIVNVKGYCPLKEYKLKFHFRYYKNNDKWQLIYIHLSLAS